MYYAYARVKAVIFLFALLFILVSCSSSDKKAIYEDVAVEKPLVVPPDIVLPTQNSELVVAEIAPQSTTYKVYSQKKSNSSADLLKTRTTGIRLVRDGAIRWLEIDAKPEALWKKSIDFFKQTGFSIKIKQPKLGIIETDWLENQANKPSNWFTQLFNKFYSSGFRDKYRVRLERNNANNRTLLFLTHQGLKKKETDNDSTDSSWVARDSDPELEAQMLQVFLVYLGNDGTEIAKVFSQSKPQKRTTLVTSKGIVNLLTVTESFSRSWRRVGLAIDRLGFTVEDKNRSAGIYYIKVSDVFVESEKKDGSFFSNIFSDKQQSINRFIITLENKKSVTHIRVLTRQGDESKSPLQARILQKLDKLLK